MLMKNKMSIYIKYSYINKPQDETFCKLCKYLGEAFCEKLKVKIGRDWTHEYDHTALRIFVEEKIKIF